MRLLEAPVRLLVVAGVEPGSPLYHILLPAIILFIAFAIAAAVAAVAVLMHAHCDAAINCRGVLG